MSARAAVAARRSNTAVIGFDIGWTVFERHAGG
jgi:hypothetical protein